MAEQEPTIEEIEALDVSDEMIAERRSGLPGSDLPSDMNPIARKIITLADTIAYWSGWIFCMLLIPLMFAMVYEVIARKFFIAPTSWAYDVSRWCAGGMFMAGAAYGLMRGVHIRADFLYRNWAKTTQAMLDGWLYIILYFPGMLFFFWLSFQFAEKAWVRGELSMETSWMAPVGYVRTAMPLGATLLLFQGVGELLRCSYDIRSGWNKIVFNIAATIGGVLGILAAIMMVRMFLGSALPYMLGLETDSALANFASIFTFADFIFNGIMEAFAALLNELKGFGGLERYMIGVIMIGVMLFSIFVGFPISFTLIFLGMFFGSWGFGAKLVFFLQTVQFNNAMQEQTLAAVPLFVFMGIMMEQAGLMERLFKAIQQGFAKTTGSLYIAVLFVSTIFAAATGIVGASVTILGIMAAKTMNKSGYNVRLSAGTITAGGTLGILIPPSIMLVVMGPVLEVPVTDLFAAAIVPGILLASLYIAYALIRCKLDPTLGPPLPESERLTDTVVEVNNVIPFWAAATAFIVGTVLVFWSGILSLSMVIAVGTVIGILVAASYSTSAVFREFVFGMIPPAALVTFSLGAILGGLATPTEAAGCGGVGALLLTMAYRKFTFSGFLEALVKTLEISVLILFLVGASNFFGAVFSNLGTPTELTKFLLTLDLSPTVILIVIMALIFLLGWPLEWVPIVLIIIPMLVPVLVELDINLTWFAILVAVNLQTAWLSPPVALSAYFLKGVVPEWDLKDIYVGMMQFMVIQLIGLILIMVFPQIALWLPNYIYGN
jgi:TRAP-type mannitol/chloroaromatic compound transport system permease large subunit/TRAP-type mannitol/chloroaromatic compound transport system permease small subunit